MAMDSLTAGLGLAETLISTIWPDKSKQTEALFKLKELEQKGDLADLNAFIAQLTGQLEINKEEAKHPSVFVAGWRPYVGWVCGTCLLYVGMLEPLLRFVAKLAGYGGTFPVIDASLTIPVLLGMLGIGAQRSYDKAKGVGTSNTK